MGNSNHLFKDDWKTVIVPIVLVFIGFIVAGTCLSTGPFLPVGLAGVIALAAIVYMVIQLASYKKKITELEKKLYATTDTMETLEVKLKDDIAKRDIIIADQKDTITDLMNQVLTLKEQLSSKPETPESVKPEPETPEVKEVKKPSKKSSKKS